MQFNYQRETITDLSILDRGGGKCRVSQHLQREDIKPGCGVGMEGHDKSLLSKNTVFEINRFIVF